MKISLEIVASVLLLSSAALAQTHGATNAPDFSGDAPPRHIDRSLVLSPGGTAPIDPSQLVTFKNDSAVLDGSGTAQVDRAALWLKVHPRYRIVLQGFTDEPGTSAYNEDLALHRI